MGIEVYHGIIPDLNPEMPPSEVPKTTLFTVYCYLNPKTKRHNKRMRCEFTDKDGNKCTHIQKKTLNFFDHLRTHTNEKPFLCPVQGCKMEFSQSSNLNKHLKKLHSSHGHSGKVNLGKRSRYDLGDSRYDLGDFSDENENYKIANFANLY